jgi:large subunit ribosomal protein L5
MLNQKEQKKLLRLATLNRIKEHSTYNKKLNALTLFPYVNSILNANFFKIILNINFKDIDFNKKKVLPFFLAMELLTNQKCIATLSSRNVLAWKLRKGMLVGCKVTLRKKNMFEFLDSLMLSLPRMEKFKPLKLTKVKNSIKNSFTMQLNETVFFYPIELGLGINSEIKKIEINFIFNNLSLEEKIFLLNTFKIPLNN